jgi:hypothetical protein
VSNPRSLASELVTSTAAPYAVAVGIAGLDLRDGAASRSPAALRELLNGKFSHDRALAKRAGHVGSVMTSADQSPQVAVEETRPWLYGWGDLSYQAFAPSPTKPPYFPIQTRGAGVAVLDDALVGATGDRLLVRRPDSTSWLPSRGVPAYTPTAKRYDRVHSGQSGASNLNAWYDVAVSTTHEVTLFCRTGSPNNEMLVTVRDLTTGALVLENKLLDTAPTASMVHGYVVFSAGVFVALWADGTDLYYAWATEAAPNVWAAATVWDTGSGDFDVEVVSDDEFLVAFRDGVDVRITYWRGRVQQSTPASPGTALVTGGSADGKLAVAVGRDRDIGLIYHSSAGGGSGTTRVGIFSSSGAAKMVASQGSGAAQQYSIAAHWNYSAGGGTHFRAWIQYVQAISLGNSPRIKNVSFVSDVVAVDTLTDYFNCRLSTRGFRVGDLACVGVIWLPLLPSSSTFQSQHAFFAVSRDLLTTPRLIGSFLRGESVGESSLFSPGGVYRTSAVRPTPGQGYNDTASPTTAKWVAGLLRWPPVGLTTLYSPQVRQVTVYFDFLPPFRAEQFGRAVYIPGAVVHTFDGRDCVEAGFVQYPEVQAVASSAAGGSLSPGDIRAYRVYAVHSNANGELARSPAITFIAPAVGVGHNANTVTFTPITLTSKTDVMFEIYATTGSGAGPGATFYLVSRNLSNAPGSSSISFVDTASNTSLLTLPADPHPAVPGLPGELLESAPPGCEIVTSGKSRLWFAGGEIPRGRIAFSKLREEGEQAGWSELTGYLDLDSTGREVTSLACQSDVLVAFQADNTYGVQGDGPTNLGSGFFPPAQLLSPGVGTPYHCGTVVSEAGIAFWAPAGPRLLTPGFQTVDVSSEVEPLARVLVPTAAVAHPGVREIRWYTESGTALMWDYTGRGPVGNRWAQWSGLQCAGAVYYPLIDGAVVCQPGGRVLLESEDETTDGGNHYEFAFRTGDVRPTDLLQGNNRFIRVAFLGEYRGEHQVGVWTHYDNAAMWDDYFTWDPDTALAVVPWGSGGGSGTWDTDTTAWIDPATQSPDGVYRFSRRLPRDRGATLSVRVSDLSAPSGGFSMDEIAFEIASENGLTKTPARTFGPLAP